MASIPHLRLLKEKLKKKRASNISPPQHGPVGSASAAAKALLQTSNQRKAALKKRGNSRGLGRGRGYRFRNKYRLPPQLGRNSQPQPELPKASTNLRRVNRQTQPQAEPPQPELPKASANLRGVNRQTQPQAELLKASANLRGVNRQTQPQPEAPKASANLHGVNRQTQPQPEAPTAVGNTNFRCLISPSRLVTGSIVSSSTYIDSFYGVKAPRPKMEKRRERSLNKKKPKLTEEFRTVVIWRCRECNKDCIPVRSESRCLCGHRLKHHPELSSEGKRGRKRKFACTQPGCRCTQFFFVVAEGAWVLRCRCKHKHIDHDPRRKPFKCMKPGCDCVQFDSPWVCSCDHSWHEHEQLFEKKKVWLLDGIPVPRNVALEVNNYDELMRGRNERTETEKVIAV
eukprot:g712.t1